MPGDTMTPAVRYLNVTLSFARDLLAEHYTASHYPVTSQGVGDAGSISLGRVTLPDEHGEPHRTAVEQLRIALGLPSRPIEDPMSEYDALAWGALIEAGHLDFDHAGHVRQAFRGAGYHATVPIPSIAVELMRLLDEHVRRLPG